ncbi:hypothetical protein QFC21_003417 [Naganishia friedmannii]|uniref:Uncharacterized protein n=1 Tax=Naganishia friedmannii TaxID=89922 RepID=A0ACC2VP75_9TREE|nr:hypothetical protein QFC21_003417 [Naganishia friedmannii]
MRITTLLSAFLATASITASGQVADVDSTYVSTIVSALKAADLNSFADVAQAIAYTAHDGAMVLADLTGVNHFVFAPTDLAFAALPKSISGNLALLADVISYHILNGSISSAQSAINPNHMVARTLYMNGLLPKNQPHPVVFDLVNDTQTGTQRFVFPYQKDNATVYADSEPVPGSPANFVIYPIHTFLSLPQNMSELAASLFPSAAAIMNETGLLEPLLNTKGVTVFAPSEAAISAAGALLNTLNSTQVETVLSNHVINGSAVYSMNLEETTYTSAGGIPFKFAINATGTFVMSGNNTARIVTADIPMTNGVVHIIDRILVNADVNTTAVQSAASSIAAQASETSKTSAEKFTGAAMLSAPLSPSIVGFAIAILGGSLAGTALI